MVDLSYCVSSVLGKITSDLITLGLPHQQMLREISLIQVGLKPLLIESSTCLRILAHVVLQYSEQHHVLGFMLLHALYIFSTFHSFTVVQSNVTYPFILYLWQTFCNVCTSVCVCVCVYVCVLVFRGAVGKVWYYYKYNLAFKM